MQCKKNIFATNAKFSGKKSRHDFISLNLNATVDPQKKISPKKHSILLCNFLLPEQAAHCHLEVVEIYGFCAQKAVKWNANLFNLVKKSFHFVSLSLAWGSAGRPIWVESRKCSKYTCEFRHRQLTGGRCERQCGAWNGNKNIFYGKGK